MSQNSAVSVVAFRAERYSPDGKSILISFRTKFSTAERKYWVPVECFRDFVVDLQRLNASAEDRTNHSDEVAPTPPKG